MKNRTKLLMIAAAGVLLFSGCIKEINPQSSNVTQNQAGNAPGAFDNFVTAITNSLAGSFTYSGGNQYPYDFGYPSFFLQRDVMGQDIALEDFGSEWYTTWYACGVGLGPQYAVSQLPWTYYYGWIKSCNTVLSLAGEKPEGERMTGAGIAYAMRAMFYMDLARMFSQKSYAIDKSAVTVPLILETTQLSELSKNPRATNDVIWTQILSDLDKAEDYLQGYQRPDVYTPDLSVVYGLKARAYLTMEDWASAEKYAKEAQKGYTVMDENQFTNRNTGFNTPNAAWMFGLTFKETDANVLANDGDSSWGSQMILEISPTECGYAANYGTPKRIDKHLFESIPATDFRKKSFVDFAIDEYKSVDEEKAIEALSVYSDQPEGLLITASATQSKAVGGLCVKFRPKDGIHDNQYQAYVVAVPLMRVEEMKLIEIEAAGMQNEGRGISLLTEFAKTRDPQFVYGLHKDENYGSNYATPFQNEVWWQRRVELWGEGFATFDIKRLDKAIIRSYAGTNHPKEMRWNSGLYTTNQGNMYPDWMDLCIVQTETNYNTECTNNPTPIKPKGDSPEYVW